MIESFKRMMQASGGWVYHRRHLMNKHRWKDFKTGIGCWLEAQIPPQNDLILIGSSAGYNLTNSFLINFQQLRVVEIDPLSPWFWKLNHKLPVQNWSTKNFFGRSPVLDPECFQKIRAAYPQSPLLFCNLLGQLGFLYEINTQLASTLKQKLNELPGPWTSFHDLFSLHGPSKELMKYSQQFKSPKNRDELIKSLVDWQQKLEINDHWTMEFIPEKKNASYFLWPLTKNSLHIVEAISQA